jgi:hypothetical protein
MKSFLNFSQPRVDGIRNMHWKCFAFCSGSALQVTKAQFETLCAYPGATLHPSATNFVLVTDSVVVSVVGLESIEAELCSQKQRMAAKKADKKPKK